MSASFSAFKGPHAWQPAFICCLISSSINACFASDYNARRSGVGALYSAEETLTITADIHGVTFGVFGNNWTTAEVRDVGSSNYGQTRIGELVSVLGFDVGYSHPVLPLLRVGAELSYGLSTQYGKYSDRRFTEGYYLSKEGESDEFGIGMTAAVQIIQSADVLINYNTIKGLGAGISFRF